MKTPITDQKVHYKSYKAGKRWLYACLSTAVVSLGLLGLTAPAQADTVNESDNTQTAQPSTEPGLATATQTTLKTPAAQPASQKTEQPTATHPETQTQPATDSTTTQPETQKQGSEQPAAVQTETEPQQPKQPATTTDTQDSKPEQPATNPTETQQPKQPATQLAEKQQPEQPTATQQETQVPGAKPVVTDQPETQPQQTQQLNLKDPVSTTSLKRTSKMMLATAKTIAPLAAKAADAEVDPTTDPNNAVNWMPDPVMRQWIETILTNEKAFIINGINHGPIVTDENLYQFTNEAFQLDNGNYKFTTPLTSLKGLERFTNLTSIFAVGARLPISGMINFDFAPNLTTFRLDDSNLTSPNWNTPLTDVFNTYLAQNTNLQFLTLRNVGVTGDLSGLSKYTQLITADLSYNQLSGTLPDLSPLNQLWYLQVQNNQLSGQLPTDWNHINTLDISNNQFSGDLPDMSGFYTIKYYQNHFSSGIAHTDNNMYDGWNQSLVGADYTQAQAQAGFNPFINVVTGVQDNTTGQPADTKLTINRFGPNFVVYSPTSPQADAQGNKQFTDWDSWSAWANQQIDASSWFKFSTDNTATPNGLTFKPTQSLPGGYYSVHMVARPTQSTSNYSAILTFKVDPAADSTITVKNVDQKGTLLSQQVLNGKVGDRISVTADDLAGYKLVSDTPTVDRTYTDAPQTITFVYAATTGTVTVQDLAPDGTILAQQTLTGNIDDAFTATAGKHYGYTVVGDNTTTGTYTAEPQTITFNFAIAKGNVTVQNVDTTGKLLSQTDLTGAVGDTFSVDADKIYGYVLTSNPIATGTYTEEPQTVTFVYDVAKGTLNVQNVDTTGKLLSQKDLTGNVGDTFTVDADKLYGYVLTSDPIATGTYTEDPQTVTFVYDVAKGTLNVQNVDTTGKLLSQKDLTGNVGDTFSVDADKLYGYVLTSEPTATGTYTEEPQTVTFVYEAAKETVTVQNVDTDGNVLSQHTLSGTVGDTFTASADTLDGYQLNGPATQTGTYTATPQTVTFTFTKLTTGGGGDIGTPTTNGTVIVQNVDTDGNILSQHTLTGTVGDTFTANADTLDGYQLTGAASQSGTYTATPQTITFVFTATQPITQDDGAAAQVTPKTPQQPEATKPAAQTGGQADKIAVTPTPQPAKAQPAMAAKVTTPRQLNANVTPRATAPAASDQPDQPTLPQTNDRTAVNPILAGFAVLLATLGLGGRFNRKKNH